MGAQASQGVAALTQVLATVLPLEALDAEIEDAAVEVTTSKMSIPTGPLHFEDTSPHRQNGHVEGAPAEVED